MYHRKRRRYRSVNAGENSCHGDTRDFQFEEQVMNEVRAIMNKQFAFQKDNSWVPPSAEQLFNGEPWLDEKLQELKRQLNDVKSLLSNYSIETWHKHTCYTNKAGNVMAHLKRNIRPEWCTQAWCKFHEIVCRFNLVPHDRAEFNSLHLCEAPGAFIASLNHYLQASGFSGQWEWRATTLNPYYEGNSLSHMIDEDRFISETLDHWHFGHDNTGNVMDVDNIRAIREACERLGPIHLITADGSIDCANNPAEQEATVACLHLSEIVASLAVLAKGGGLVLKLFTLFEYTSVGLMYLLNCSFSRVTVFKPATSKAGNSEVYAVCEDYCGLAPDSLQKLQQHIDVPLCTSIVGKEDIATSYLEQHRQCCEMFMKFQTDTISTNMHLFENMTDADRQWLAAVKDRCVDAYMESLGVVPIEESQWVVPNQSKNHHKKPAFKYGKRHVGSFQARLEHSNLPWQQKVLTMVTYDVPEASQVHWLQGSPWSSDSKLEGWHTVHGREVQRVKSSKFCDQLLLQSYNEMVDNSKAVGSNMDRAPDISAITGECDELVRGYRVLLAGAGDICATTALAQQEQSANGMDDRPRLYVRDVADKTVPKTPGAAMNSHSLLTAFIPTVLTLSEGDSVLFTMTFDLTRASTACLYIVHRLFEQLCVYDTSEELGCTRVVMGRGYRGCSERLGTYLQDVVTQCEHQDPNSVVLQFIPVAEIIGSELYDHLADINNNVLKRRINKILKTEQLKAHSTSSIT